MVSVGLDWVSASDWPSLFVRFVGRRFTVVPLFPPTRLDAHPSLVIMDSLLLLGLGAVLVAAVAMWLRASSAAAAQKDLQTAKGQAWRGTGATNIDPVLRNR